MAEAPDFEAEGLLDGLDDERERAARLELLQQLHEEGVPLEELRQAVDEERLALLPVEHVLAGEPTYTAEDLARESGLDLDYLERERRAMGLPVPDRGVRAYGEADLEAARRAARFLEAGFPEEASIEVVRVVGASMARVAEAMRATTGEALARPGDTERDIGLRIAEFAQLRVGELGRPALLRAPAAPARAGARRRHHAGRGGRRRVCIRARRTWRSPSPTSSASRGWESGRPVDELGAVAGRLAELAAAVSPSRRCAWSRRSATPPCWSRPSPAPLLDATLDLVDAAEEEGDEFPQLRAGVALGPAPCRAGRLVRPHRQRGQPGHAASRGRAACWPPSRSTTRWPRPTAGRSPASGG